MSSSLILPSRWESLKYHKVQQALWSSKARFRVVVAGRRSGKTELAKRHLVLSAITTTTRDAWFVAGAPVSGQAKRIFWEDIKALTPPMMIRPTSGHGSGNKLDISESELSIRLMNGATITVMGLDEASRLEGKSLDGIVLDEYASMKPDVWEANVRPALSTLNRPGWAWFTGVPEGRNHFYKLFRKAQDPTRKNWEAFHWKSAEVLSPDEIADAKRDLDPRMFRQEYEADFVDFSGRTYYCFKEEVQAQESLPYFPEAPLIIAFDFNTSPGTASIHQEILYQGDNPKVLKPTEGTVTASIGEVWIEEDSNTAIVCDRILDDWHEHRGEVHLYGDATGGAKGTAQVDGSDWDIIRSKFRPVFGDRLRVYVGRSNPREKVRVNAVNRRFLRADDVVSWLVDPQKCPHLVEDLLGTRNRDDGSGEIDKDYDKMLTHLSDGAGYYIVSRWPYDAGDLEISQG